MSFSFRFAGLFTSFLLSIFILLVGTSTSSAHFADNYVVRSFLAAGQDDSIIVYQRVPAPLLYADLLQNITALPKDDRTAEVFADSRGGGSVILSVEAIEQARDTFEQRLLGHAIWSGPDGPVTPTLLGWRIDPGRLTDNLQTAEAAAQALDRPGATHNVNMVTATVEFALRFDVPSETRLRVVSALPLLALRPGLQLENHVTDLRPTPPHSFSVPGQLETPMSISPGAFEIFLQFVYQGMVHVFGGLDHVLLIVCVTLGCFALRPLLIGLTGFTIGHSITLILGFLGVTAPGSTFIILVETAVAATVTFAAIQALRKRPAHPVALVLVGLLHGFGFSFVLRNILGPDSPDLIPSLLAFNIGIEVAQVIIVLILLAVGLPLRRLSPRAFHYVTSTVLIGSLAIAGVWCVERLAALFA